MKSNKSICIGAGLVALDVVINGSPKTPLKLFAGGSCGNVLTILSFLNWETYPVARLKKNEAYKNLLADLIHCKVNTSLLTQAPDGSTPIIIHKITKDKCGNSIHRFKFKDPDTYKWLPSYKVVLKDSVQEIITKSPIPTVFYFDRVNRSSIELAKYYKENRALIFFEPSSIHNMKQFEECLNLADIIKFSNERIKNYSELFPKQRVVLEIETLGKEGVRYRYSQLLKAKRWNSIPGYKISYAIDAAGAGDWFTAGIISKIANKGILKFQTCNKSTISIALKYGQALGALNCIFDGARGLMYNIDRKKVESLVKELQSSLTPITFIGKNESIKRRKKFSISSLYED